MTLQGLLTRIHRRDVVMTAPRLLLASAALTLPPALARAASDERWPSIRAALFGERPIEDAGDRLDLATPPRAEDAAIVPISFAAHAANEGPEAVRHIHLIIDNNPAPRAAVFHFPAGGALPQLATRIRINEYTPVRLIAETEGGRLLMTERFVKAAGGCSAPAGKDQVAALARLGRMKLNGAAAVRPGQPATVQVLISHPNNSGLQFDQMSRTYVPAHYVTELAVLYGGREIFTADSDISISEDPSFHITFVPPQADTLAVHAMDTKGGRFEGSWPLGGGANG